ncbi:gas vesicle protein GvpG [Halochromatium glycolicum]|nr:gas vesicle protein GvpG [Halochromatium glycolicum]
MLVVDDILFSPYRGLLWLFKEIHNAALEEVEGEATRIRNELTNLYMMLETGELDEAEFDRREGPLLDRLDEIEADEEEEDDDEFDDDEFDDDEFDDDEFDDDEEDAEQLDEEEVSIAR